MIRADATIGRFWCATVGWRVQGKSGQEPNVNVKLRPLHPRKIEDRANNPLELTLIGCYGGDEQRTLRIERMRKSQLKAEESAALKTEKTPAQSRGPGDENIPQSFFDALEDFEKGRVVDMEVALRSVPKSAK
jgi:hypothetical protein